MRALSRKLHELERKLGGRTSRPVVCATQWPGGPDAISPEAGGEYARMKRGGGPAKTNAEGLAEATARAEREGARLIVIQAVCVRPDGSHDEGHYLNDASSPDGVRWVHDDGTRTRYPWGDAPLPSRPL